MADFILLVLACIQMWPAKKIVLNEEFDDYQTAKSVNQIRWSISPPPPPNNCELTQDVMELPGAGSSKLG